MSIEANESFSSDHNWPFIRAVAPLQKPVVTAIVLQTFFTIVFVMVAFLKLLLSSFIWDRVNKACFSKFLMGCYDLKPSIALFIFFLCDFVQCFLLCLFFSLIFLNILDERAGRTGLTFPLCYVVSK